MDTTLYMKNINNISQLDVTNTAGSQEFIAPVYIEASGPLEFQRLTFRDEGVLILVGECQLKVAEVNNFKSKEARHGYEFLITGKEGKDAQKNEDAGDAQDAGTVELVLGKVNNDIRISAYGSSGGKGYDSVKGKDGGKGGDGYQGGDGGSGGDASVATNGGKGGSAPTVTVSYETIEKKAAIYINGDRIKNRIRYEKELPGGKGGDGGKGIKPSLDGKPGKDGAKAVGGIAGENGRKGKVSVARLPLEKRLKDMNGLYIFDLSDEEERSYCIKQLGGMEALKDKPLLLDAIGKASTSVADSVTKSPENNDKKSPISIHFVENRFKKFNTAKGSNQYNSTDGTEYFTMEKTFQFNLYDNITEISDISPALKWKSISVTGSIDNITGEIAHNLGSISYEDEDTNGRTENFISNPHPENIFGGTLATSMKIKGYTVDDEFFYAEYSQKEKLDSAITYTVEDIVVDNPHWNKKHDSYIVMLYGRTNQLPEYANPDYIDGDYLNNTIKKNTIATLMPVSGTVTFADDYELVGLTPPDPVFKFTRPYINYDNKATTSQESNSSDITYQNDLDNNSLYEKINNEINFTKHSGITHPKVDFDFQLDRKDNTSKLDWHDDISGAADDRKRQVLLTAGFKYRLHKKGDPDDVFDDIPINIVGITKENLKQINREYYQFVKGSNTVYIPPIYIYWGCFGKDVRIKIGSGFEKTAAEVKIGDQLLSYGGATVTVADVITGRDATICRLKLSGGYETLLSGAHRLLDENGKGIPVKKLKQGDKVLTENGRPAVVESVQEEEYNDMVYNFSFENQTGSVYIIADGLCAGDFHAQNEENERPAKTAEEAELDRRRMEELRRLL